MRSQRATTTLLKGTKKSVLSCMRPYHSQTARKTTTEPILTTHGNHRVSSTDSRLLRALSASACALTISSLSPHPGVEGPAAAIRCRPPASTWDTPRARPEQTADRRIPIPVATRWVDRGPPTYALAAPELVECPGQQLKVEVVGQGHGCGIDGDLTELGEETHRERRRLL